jgi:hypothetical protein
MQELLVNGHSLWKWYRLRKTTEKKHSSKRHLSVTQTTGTDGCRVKQREREIWKEEISGRTKLLPTVSGVQLVEQLDGAEHQTKLPRWIRWWLEMNDLFVPAQSF